MREIAGRGIPSVSLTVFTIITSFLWYFSMAGSPKNWKNIACRRIWSINLIPIKALFPSGKHDRLFAFPTFKAIFSWKLTVNCVVPALILLDYYSRFGSILNCTFGLVVPLSDECFTFPFDINYNIWKHLLNIVTTICVRHDRRTWNEKNRIREPVKTYLADFFRLVEGRGTNGLNDTFNKMSSGTH